MPFSHLQSWMAHVYGPYKGNTSVLCLSHTVCFSVVGPLSSPLHLSAHVCSKPTSDRLLSIQYPSPVKGSQQAPISFKPSRKYKPCVCLPNMFHRWKPSSRTFLDVSFISLKIYIFSHFIWGMSFQFSPSRNTCRFCYFPFMCPDVMLVLESNRLLNNNSLHGQISVKLCLIMTHSFAMALGAEHIWMKYAKTPKPCDY